jgi:glycosyltransferase involved in cell wall biosynthesis
MHIVYDHQIFSKQKYGGISRYYYEIASRLTNINQHYVNIHAGLFINKYLENSSKKILKGWYFPYQTTPKTKKILDVINTGISKVLLNRNPPDIVHETYYSRRSIAPKKSKIVMTVYDMIHEKFSKSMPELRKDLYKIKTEAVKRADHIICISENTKNDLVEMIDIDAQKVSTIHLGYSLQANTIIEKKSKIIHPYILYVGDRTQEYKNFKRLLYAYASSARIIKNFSIVCFGSKAFSTEEITIMNQLGIDESKIIHIVGDDDILANLYTHASAFVYPSLYEGFGIPPLEAMSFDCPVVCSNVSSIPEVVADAGEYFNPYEIDSIVDALEKLLFCSERFQELIIRGKKRLKHFSWDKCTYEHSLVYKSLV